MPPSYKLFPTTAASTPAAASARMSCRSVTPPAAAIKTAPGRERSVYGGVRSGHHSVTLRLGHEKRREAHREKLVHRLGGAEFRGGKPSRVHDFAVFYIYRRHYLVSEAGAEFRGAPKSLNMRLPAITRPAPADTARATVSALRRPPPYWTNSPSEAIAESSFRCFGSPVRAPSRSTTWMRGSRRHGSFSPRRGARAHRRGGASSRPA